VTFGSEVETIEETREKGVVGSQVKLRLLRFNRRYLSVAGGRQLENGKQWVERASLLWPQWATSPSCNATTTRRVCTATDGHRRVNNLNEQFIMFFDIWLDSESEDEFDVCNVQNHNA